MNVSTSSIPQLFYGYILVQCALSFHKQFSIQTEVVWELREKVVRFFHLPKQIRKIDLLQLFLCVVLFYREEKNRIKNPNFFFILHRNFWKKLVKSFFRQKKMDIFRTISLKIFVLLIFGVVLVSGKYFFNIKIAKK